MGNLDLPFEGQEPAEGVLGADSRYASGVVVMSAVVPVPGAGNRPAVVFRFANPDGSGFYPALILVGMEAHTLANLPGLVQQAVATAERGAS